ncbi:hypothetical protein CgunFtcFv8_015275 [Champsocephalus gunnari]|uniref:Uncharacterized protein n=1 Tax=Champsocephalus gunnari TaxID=52237 RepID=A0AAN8H0J8_CHAGU|nr:hypothetical protein CgunFtcFv8_015275 [Champsocephalus gunnari]
MHVSARVAKHVIAWHCVSVSRTPRGAVSGTTGAHKALLPDCVSVSDCYTPWSLVSGHGAGECAGGGMWQCGWRREAWSAGRQRPVLVAGLWDERWKVEAAGGGPRRSFIYFDPRSGAHARLPRRAERPCPRSHLAAPPPVSS